MLRPMSTRAPGGDLSKLRPSTTEPEGDPGEKPADDSLR
jgi:hypothetical protein